MNPPLVTIVTPTFNRAGFLPLLYQCVLAQDLHDFEWLILDDSAEPCAVMQDVSDHRVVYIHEANRRSVGAKRNILIERARGKIIAHFDDDDYYASGYLSKMVRVMRERQTAMAKLFGYFVYSDLYKTFGYWDLINRSGSHMVWSKKPMAFTTLNDSNNGFLKDNHLGYGFSYVFEKEVWNFAKFPDVDWNEDVAFIKQALERFSVAGVQDPQCTCIHVLHETNTSLCLPQYLIPNLLLDKLFPGSQTYLALASQRPLRSFPSPQ